MAAKKPHSRSRNARRSRIPLILGAAAALALAAGLWHLTRPQGESAAGAETADSSPAGNNGLTSRETAAMPEALEAISGRWVRPDGGYVLEIREGRAGGHLDVAYFNPRPIHVSRAAWMESAGGLQVFVELTDTGYPGATYMLTYDPDRDVLSGIYTQPAYQQDFDVEFTRLRE